MPTKLGIIDISDPKTNEYLTKIGTVIVLLNHLESLIEFYIWELIGAQGSASEIQAIGRRITSDLEFQQKLDLLRALIVERHGEEEAKSFIELYKEIKGCGEIRNDIAHSQWFIQYGENREDLSTSKINIKKAFERGKAFDFSKAKKEVALDELEEYIQKIDKATVTLVGFALS